MAEHSGGVRSEMTVRRLAIIVFALGAAFCAAVGYALGKSYPYS